MLAGPAVGKGLWGLAVVAVAAASVGCGGPRIGRYDVEVALAPALRGSSLDVDLVGVGDVNRSQWEGKDLREYFSGRDPFRQSQADMRHTMRFSPQSPEKMTLPRTAPIWDTWRRVGYDELYILADVPGRPQKLVLPMQTNRWDGRLIRVEVREGSVTPLTPMKPAS